MEALFIDPDVRGTGIGRQLLQHALARHPQLTTDVNEQNAQAVGFLPGRFVNTARFAGRPYPDPSPAQRLTDTEARSSGRGFECR